MNEQEIKKTIITLLKNIAPDTDPDELKENDNIQEILSIDSFDWLQFIVALNKKLGIEIPEQDYGEVAHLRDLLFYVTKKMKPK
ncbi:acyl carrier protein [Flavobacterium sp. WC2430]|uniref:acyl carrier protein n=1 Tax=Flavobacterium sp. WC2430 TaxID=3234137 RepID=UPI0034677C91